MNPPAINHPPAEAARLPALVRLIRRICLLREQAGEAEAARVEETEFAAAIRHYRQAHGADALPESELRVMFAAEENRVADALVLSELLVPQLVGPLAARAAGPGRAAPPLPAREPPAPAPRAIPAGSPAIPELLDAMLAADRARPHPLSSARHSSSTVHHSTSAL